MAEGGKARTELPAKGLELEQYQPELHRYLVRCMRSNRDIEDLLQDVYVRFLQSPHKDLVRQPRPYLYRIAANVVAEFNLRQRRQPLTYDSDIANEKLEEKSAADDLADAHNDQRQLLTKILQRLPKIYRTVLVMRMREGLTHEEIAQKLNLAPVTARTYLSRALALCRAAQWDR